MTGLKHIRRLHADNQAASAVEFALVVPVMILFLLGIIDVGRFIWNTNEVEKAVQIGTRWAVATDYVGSDLPTYSYAISGVVPQGMVVGQENFSGVHCEGNSDGSLECQCAGAGSTCPFNEAVTNQAAFSSLVGRMNSIYAGIGPGNVEVNYDWSGLGYSGDPNGSDVDPLVTVTVKDVAFRPIFLAGIFNFGLPDLSYTLTMEDGEGSFSN